MAKHRDRPATNPLHKDRVAAIAKPMERQPPIEAAVPRASGESTSVKQEQRSHRARDKGRAIVHVKTRFSQSEAEQVDRFARTISSYLRSTVKGSEVTRALWTLAIRAEDELASIAGKAPKMDRPSYGDRLGMAEYEDAIADFLLLALKQTRRR